MGFIVFMVAAASAQPSAPALVQQMSEVVGATHRQVWISGEAETADEQEVMAEALVASGLFTLSEEGSLKLTVTRHNDQIQLVATDTRGAQLWRWDGQWRARDIPDNEEERYEAVREYYRKRIQVVPTSQIRFGMPWSVGYGAGFRRGAMGFGFDTGVPATTTTHDWLLVQGRASIIDEMDLARMLGDGPLVRRIEDERFWHKFYWGAGLGIGAAAGIGTGIWLQDDSYSRDTRTIGTSLITLGIASGILAIVMPLVSESRVLDAAQAEQLTDEYNRQLREQLHISPLDLKTYPAE